MIDSTDAEVMERALTWCQGKSVLNSINLEDGRSRFERVAPMARRYGAALVVGTIDEQGMAVSVERKLEIARRSYEILTEEFDHPARGHLVGRPGLPLRHRRRPTSARRRRPSRGAGDQGRVPADQDRARRLQRQLRPADRRARGAQLGLSLPRDAAGLDAAIVNTQKLARFAEIPDEERALAEKLIYLEPGDAAASEAAVAEFAAHFRGRKSRRAAAASRAAARRTPGRAVVEGTKEGLAETSTRPWPTRAGPSRSTSSTAR